jgi:hypothetical protein
VDNFSYLGVIFKANLSWALMKTAVMRRARQRMALVAKAMATGLASDASLKLWQTMIRPVLEYAVETWGLLKWPEAERLQLEMGRLILGVRTSTASSAVRGELGLWRMSARIQFAVLRWWGKLVSLPRDRIVYRVFRWRKDHIRHNRPSFCAFVRDLLTNLQLGDVWLSEEVGDLKAWNALIREKIDREENKFFVADLLAHPKLRTYRLFKKVLRREDYLTLIPSFDLRREMARLRTGASDLRIESGRWTGTQELDRLCWVCGQGAIENEEHFLLECVSYEDLRIQMFSSIRYLTGDAYGLTDRRDDSRFLLKVLLGLTGVEKRFRPQVIIAVAKYVRRAMIKRRRLLM